MNDKPVIGTHYFDDRNNVLYDLMQERVIRLEITQKIPGAEGQPDTERKYSLAELYLGVERKLMAYRDQAEKAGSEQAATENAEENPDLVLVSFYGFLASPGVTGMLTGFHNSWLHGFYVAKLIKNRNLVVSAMRATMTPDDRKFAEEKLRDSGVEPYDPGQHGSAETQPGT